MNGFYNPKIFFLTGIVLILIGLAYNHYSDMRGELHIGVGETKILVADQKNDSIQHPNQENPGLKITLDSFTVYPYTPEFEVLLFGPDTSSGKTASSSATGPLMDKFPAEPMKIRKAGDSGFYFRLKEFYPNFQFAYEYPEIRDTIEPRAPGITLELKTREGKPIVTLRTDQPNKYTLDDIVSLGAPLFFYWEKSADSVKAMGPAKGKGKNRIVFSGSDRKVFFMFNDTLTEQTLVEGTFYKVPGLDTVGFTIMYCFPDYAYLKAVPSSKDTQMLNPVGQVEVWKEGEGYREAFLYPEKRGRKGGVYSIPESGYKLGLGEIMEKAVKHCDCYLAIQADSSETPKKLALFSGRPGRFRGYRFTPLACAQSAYGMVDIGITKKPGRKPILFGITVISLILIYIVLKRLRSENG